MVTAVRQLRSAGTKFYTTLQHACAVETFEAMSSNSWYMMGVCDFTLCKILCIISAQVFCVLFYIINVYRRHNGITLWYHLTLLSVCYDIEIVALSLQGIISFFITACCMPTFGLTFVFF